MDVRTKPKHTRASAPKVRTGCLTWIRHVKCDEAKPTCKKCQAGKVVCDGYPAAEDKQVPQKKPRKTRAPPRNEVSSLVPLPRACLDPDALRDHTDSAFFHHFRTCTIPDLALPPYSTSFWDRHILPLGNAVPAVRCATTALGVAHRAFLLDPSDPSAHQAREQLENIAVQQYNKAISHLLPNATSRGVVDVRTILTCSLLFYCLENIRGRPDESIQHLRYGARLITSRAPHLLTETGRPDAGGEGSIEEIARLFARIGVQASLYKEDEVVADLTAYMRPTQREPHDSSQPFGDFAVARDALDDLDIDHATIHNRAFVLVQAYKKNLRQSVSESPIYVNGFDQAAAFPGLETIYGPSYADGLDVGPIISRFRIWRRRFDKTVQQAEERGPTKRERHEIAMLELRRRTWETNLDEIPSGSPEQADRILDQAELVLRLFGSKHSIFTLESHISPSVSFICFYSNEERHRRRALDILRSARMREAVWDSGSMVRIIEPQFADTARGGAL